MIRVSHLTKIFGQRPAIEDLSFHVKKGEVVGFLGPNGAGKSTTMKILTGFMPATTGNAIVAGFDVFENSIEVKKNIGFLPENPPVYLEMSVEDYLIFAAQLHQVPKSRLSQALSDVLEKTSLTHVRKRLIGNLSKGYRQRVGLAQALIHNPAVLILDEPTVGLDPKQIIEIRELIRGLASDHTVVLSSHILPEVTATCQRIIVINQGKIVAEDTIDDLTAKMKKSLNYTLTVERVVSEAIEALKKITGVETVTSSHDKVMIQMKPGTADIRSQIIQKSLEKGMGVLEFSAEKVSLEDIFLQLTTVENKLEGKSDKI